MVVARLRVRVWVKSCCHRKLKIGWHPVGDVPMSPTEEEPFRIVSEDDK